LNAARIVGPMALAPARAEAILRTLPEWFGQEATLLGYAQDVAALATFSAWVNDVPVAFASLRPHFDETTEISCIAVERAYHGSGLGSRIVEATEHWWRTRGGRLLQVKTLGPSHADPYYALTRRFYARMGFLPVEEFATLWSARHPCLLLVKPVD
jgi:GNAT superfamily N-acetyltransferase